MFKKAQSALEFLTTYGWAFLVILIMIGALAYFGVLDPSRFLPDKCVFTTGFSCQESVSMAAPGVGQDHINAKVINSVGKDVAVQQMALGAVTITGSASCTAATAIALTGVDADVTDAATATWSSGAEGELQITCNAAPAAGERLTINVDGTYREIGSTYDKPFEGTLSLRVQ